VIDQVRIAYTALRSQLPPPDGELSVLPIKSVGGAFVGVDEDLHPHLVLTAGAEPAPSSESAALDIGTRVLLIEGQETAFIDIVCILRTFDEVFEYFVVAVLDRLAKTDDTTVAAISTVLDTWREFLAAAAAPPGRDKLAAVFGELLVVLDVVLTSRDPSVDFWVGPFGSRHDLRNGPVALEVKTTQSHTGRRVTVHGEDQLVPPDSGRLFLHLVRLEQVPGGGRSVSSLVDELLEASVSPEALFDAVTAAGVPLNALAASADVTFDVRERFTVVVDDRTPKIVPSSFIDGRRPTGVVDLRYTIDLDYCLAAALTLEEYNEIMSSLAVKGDR
jgi:hypothetical protein